MDREALLAKLAKLDTKSRIALIYQLDYMRACEQEEASGEDALQ